MRTLIRLLAAGCAFAQAPAFAADPDEAGRDIGAVLAWRLAPELFEERCRDVDPAGAEARKKALATWQTRNAALIKTVDERVAEVVPLAYPSANPAETIARMHAHVKKLLLETTSAPGDEKHLETACKEAANPANPRWGMNGVPQTQNSLAALYDWKMQKEKASTP